MVKIGIYLAALDFDQMVEQYHLALGELGKGNPEPTEKLSLIERT